MSFASWSPIEIRAPSAPNGRIATPACAQAAAKSWVSSPSRSQTKLASVGGTVQPWAVSSPLTRDRSLTTRSTRSSSSASAASEATAAAWATAFTVNGSMVLRTAPATGGCATRKPTRSPASP